MQVHRQIVEANVYISRCIFKEVYMHLPQKYINQILNTNIIVLDPVVFEMYEIKHVENFISDIQMDSNSDWIPPCLQTTCVTEFQILGWVNNESQLNTV